MSQIEPPPHKVEKFVFVWKEWLNRLWIYAKDVYSELTTHTDKTSWNAHGNAATGGGPYTLDGDLACTGHGAFGTDGANSLISVIDVDETIDPAGSQGAGLRFDVDMDTSTVGSKITSLGATVTNVNSDVFGSAQVWGMDIREQQNGPNGLVSMYGLYTKGGSAASTGTIASYAGVVIASPTFAVKPGIANGIVVNNQNQSNTITTGITVSKQTSAASEAHGIVLSGDGFGANIIFGASKDATIYYDNTDLIIDPDLVGTGKVLIGATGDDDMKLNAIEIDGDLNHDGSNIGFFGTTPIAKQTTTSQTPATFTANTSGIADDTATWNGYTIGDVVAILQAYGLLT